MSVAAIPGWLTGTKRGQRVWAMAGSGIVVLIAVLYFALSSGSAGGSPARIGQLYEVVPMDLEIKVTKDGEIHAINNIDILCEVEGTSTITTIVKEGTSVKKGDVLLTLDSTEIRQKLEDTALQLQKAEADLANAVEMLEIQKDSNATDLEGAMVAVSIAQLELKQYEEGTYPQQLLNAQTEVKMARITLENRLEDLEQSKKLYAKNFVTAADVKKAELDVTNARNALAKAETALKVLTEYTHEIELTSKRNAVVQAERRLQRTKRSNASNLSWRSADVNSKERNLNVLKRRYERLQEQLAACEVKAPSDGMVVYGSSTDRHAQTQIQEGAQVRERQLLIRLPDTSAMKAVVRIHESLVSYLQEGQKAMVSIVGQSEPVPARVMKISVLADNSQRWWNPDLREYPVDIALEVTPDRLKPGIGATVEIFVERLSNVLAVPLDAVYTVGEERFAFVQQGEEIHPVRVQVGKNNATHVQIVSGLEEGMRVLRLQAGQGRVLLEKAGIHTDPTTRPNNDKDKSRQAVAKA